MDYDISTIENCYQTMQRMTDFPYWEDIFKIYAYQYIDEPDRMRKEIMESKNIQIKDIDTKDINFILLHVTTSADKCNGIRKNGLHDLIWTYEHDTELRRFLDENNIYINIEKKIISVDGTEYDLPNNIYESGGVGYKLFGDPYVCGCFQWEKNSPYGGQVHVRAEIIYNINKLVKGKNLEYEWFKTHKPYTIKFTVPYEKMMIALNTSMKDKKEAILQTMFAYAFNTVFYHRFSSDYIGILNYGEYVPAKDIISIEEY